MWPTTLTTRIRSDRSEAENRTMEKKLNYELIHFHLREALGEIEDLYNIASHLADLPTNADESCFMLDAPDEGELNVRLAHAYHHLNTAWNARHQSREEANARFHANRKFPRATTALSCFEDLWPKSCLKRKRSKARPKSPAKKPAADPAALRDARVTRPDRAVIVAWMLVVTNMNAEGYPSELDRVVADDPTCLDVLFPALWARVAYYRARRPGFQSVKLMAGDKADSRWYWNVRQSWEERLRLTADEDGALDRIYEKRWRLADGKPADVSGEVAAFVDAMKRAGRRPSRTLLMGLFDSSYYWDVIAYLYEHDPVCWKAWPVEEALILHCADGDINYSCEFIELVDRLRPGCVGRVRDPFGCNLLWLTLYQGLARHGHDHGHWASPFLEKALIDCGCDPHETNVLGVSWADVARAQYACGISRRSREWDLWEDDWPDEVAEKPRTGMGWLAEILGADWHEPDEGKDGR